MSNKTLDRLLLTQKELKENKKQISDLSDKELDEMIALYKIQTEIKKKKLREYKEKFMKHRKI